jgi:hypothetical protein
VVVWVIGQFIHKENNYVIDVLPRASAVGVRQEDDDWYQCKDDEYLNIFIEDAEEPKPPQAMELREHPGTWRATMRQWADFNGKGFLCSINY